MSQFGEFFAPVTKARMSSDQKVGEADDKAVEDILLDNEDAGLGDQVSKDLEDESEEAIDNLFLFRRNPYPRGVR